jgi:predicted dehydrogenase
LTDDLRRAWPWFNNYTQHVLDLLRYYLGPPTAVLTSHPVHNPVSVVTLDWAGARVVLMDGPSQPGKWEEWIEFHYDKGWLRFRTPPALAVRVTGQVDVYRAAEGRRETYDSPPEWAFRNEMRQFLRAVAGEIPPSPNADDALAIQHLTEEIFRTAMEMPKPRSIGDPWST